MAPSTTAIRAFCMYTGFSAEEVMGSGWQKTIHPEDAARAGASVVGSRSPLARNIAVEVLDLPRQRLQLPAVRGHGAALARAQGPRS